MEKADISGKKEALMKANSSTGLEKEKANGQTRMVLYMKANSSKITKMALAHRLIEVDKDLRANSARESDFQAF